MKKDAKSIVVVDDTESVTFALLELLKDEGFDVKAYNNPLEAIEEIKLNGSPDYIITDYKMPEMNGVDMLAEVEKINPGTNAIIMSADPGDVKQKEPKYHIIEKTANFFDRIISIVRGS